MNTRFSGHIDLSPARKYKPGRLIHPVRKQKPGTLIHPGKKAKARLIDISSAGKKSPQDFCAQVSTRFLNEPQ